MKKTLTFIFLLAALIANAQDTRAIAYEIIDETSAIIEQRTTTGNDLMLYTYPPSFYNLELIVQDVKNVLKEHTDNVFVRSTWEKIKDKDTYSMYIDVNNKLLVLHYEPNTGLLLFYCFL